ncbi:MAG: hypothetical protein OEM77_03115 [Nitrosopumilus sp.]|nr:hypothetical protein [Nitrosopumilus sp.]MDH3735816.1 hypothetical protein [Nitrosopumilus sp.]MDH3833144.1 hypothetical protein [Nitrosopumilus sp.]
MTNLELEIKNLHEICMTIGEIKQQLVEELPHYGHHGLFLQNDEITTGLLNNKDEVKINLLSGQLLYFENERGSFIDLKNDDVLEKLKFITSSKKIKISTDFLNNTTEQELMRYHDFAKKALQMLELFRMNLRDNFTLIHLWPHHFDFSLEWFTGNQDEQIGTGISPGDKQYSNPYLYMNSWPFEEKLTEKSLPIGTWNTNGWKGIKVEWDELVQFTPKEAAKKITELFSIVKNSF